MERAATSMVFSNGLNCPHDRHDGANLLSRHVAEVRRQHQPLAGWRGSGCITWTEDDIAAFEATHPIGTLPRRCPLTEKRMGEAGAAGSGPISAAGGAGRERGCRLLG